MTESADVLVALADLTAGVRPEALVYAGAITPELSAFLASRTTAPPILCAGGRDARPDENALTALRGSRVFALLDGLSPASVFVWASTMHVAGSMIVARAADASWPDFAAVGCARRPTEISDAVVIERLESAPPSDPPAIPRRRRPRRPLRSVFLGDLHYPSLYRAGVAQGMAQLGAWHRAVDIRREGALIDRQVREMRPDLIWTHMLLWPPANGLADLPDLLGLAEMWRRHGAVVIVHDGDPREHTRFPHDVSRSVDLALCNHTRPVREWNVPAVRWPYAALAQTRIGEALPELRADLVFAGILRDGGLYGARSSCLRALAERIGVVTYPAADGVNNRFQIADVAPSTIAMIGFGRPEAPGWIDTRVFTVPGAGGVLIHDDVGGVLEPHVHYIPCKRYDVDSILVAFEEARRRQDEIRPAAFAHVQAHHTYRQRCQQVLDLIYEPEA